MRPSYPTIDEDHGRQLVDEGESSELFRVELAVRAASNDAANHDEDAVAIRLLDRATERLAPTASTFIWSKGQHVPHLGSSAADVASEGQRPDEGDRLLPMLSGVVPVPLLALLALVGGVEEIGTGMANIDVTDGPEVGDRKLLIRRLRKE